MQPSEEGREQRCATGYVLRFRPVPRRSAGAAEPPTLFVIEAQIHAATVNGKRVGR